MQARIGRDPSRGDEAPPPPPATASNDAQQPHIHVPAFSLDSKRIKAEIDEFLRREHQLALLARPRDTQQVAPSVERELAASIVTAQREATKRSYERLIAGLGDTVDGADGSGLSSITIAYGSDGGNAAGVARRLAQQATRGGVREVRCVEANELDADELFERGTTQSAGERRLVLVIATAGQGEHCTNALAFGDALKRAAKEAKGATSAPPMLSYAVFGLGDSHYWGEGTADSATYFCAAAREADEALSTLGASRLVETGLGDDQHADGYDGTLGEWTSALWDALEITVPASAGDDEDGAPKIVDDAIKGGSNYLRGTLKEGLADLSTGKLLPEDTKLTKFHGIYQQDLRSVREERDAAGLERAYSFMIRVGLPGGIGTAEQYCVMDQLCTDYANGRLKLTTRQAYQLHGVLKKDLKTTMKGINKGLMDTLAACGDVCRNVMGSPFLRGFRETTAASDAQYSESVGAEVARLAHAISAHLKPRTSAYHEIWLDKKRVGGGIDHEPLYGETYLPRKFKVAIAVPPLNDVDVFAHCCGFIAIVSADGSRVEGWNVTAGGGMGVTHGNKATYPRLADVMGSVRTIDEAVRVCEKVMLVQRDHGDRENRPCNNELCSKSPPHLATPAFILTAHSPARPVRQARALKIHTGGPWSRVVPC